jgi:hypothetical protein
MSSNIGQVRNTMDRVTSAIATSAQRTGVNFDYLMGQARVESGFNPNAKAPTSSATGLFQFIEQSWLGVIDKHGPKHGLGWAANAISRDGRGRFSVSDGPTRQAILNLRKNPEVASLMAGEFAADNRNYLERGLGRSAAPVDLYLAHFLGAEGARKFLSAHDRNPDAAAAPQFGSAARANRNVFYDPSGSPRSFAQIRDRFAAKLGDSAHIPAGNRGGNSGGRGLPHGRDEGGNDLPFVQPADYLRLASQRANTPRTGADGQPLNLMNNENARLAYMLLASIGA